ncbi:MAG: polyribonucleotide nucleotidyltransferase [Candidatus Omnitrophica bacterium CG07_land_8_20_14_0_80_42_15]|uniref:Polyribonucleotide nucleotidyltransferase n=1 Tax=Candidatus Aquitaenariimonas noxiae TaxID=1974741 RepID=A0A2J0KUH8_9BACT|nr:MAG: polyribonucleotide nucleotidyltransferase [Candidatus Omnitrophica bacterium CG07_land_8_20_14_0_80_42_15]
MIKKFELSLGRENIVFETGKMAKQANGSLTVRLGDTVVLVTAVASKDVREGIDFFPLTVEYQEKTYAAGKIPGGFFKREGRPSEKEILTARLIDRPIRPLFPEGFINEVQVMALVVSSDGKNDSDILAVNGASAALMISDIPFNGPIGAVRVGKIKDEFILNPTFQELAESPLDLVVSGTREGVIMMEMGSKELDEPLLLEAMKYGYKEILKIIGLQEKMAKEIGRPKMSPELKLVKEDLYEKVRGLAKEKLNHINKVTHKEGRIEEKILLLKELIDKLVTDESGYTKEDVSLALGKLEKIEVRKFILEGRRIDGRSFTDMRPIACEVGILPRTHGSGLFTRGQTQSLAVTTLGTSADEQVIDALEGESLKTFMLHYNFPPFSVGEVKPVRGPGRREIGHGALAERSLHPVMPSKEAFPYTVRVVSDILESNGSSSMATVCGSSLSLMDAGVPIKAAVSGIAIGLVKEKDKAAILTDIAGIEDHCGDMDFKVAGTRKGVTAIQLDLKIDGLNFDLIKKALDQAKAARLEILDKIYAVISGPRDKLSAFAPRIVNIKISLDKIKDVIGPGGKVIRKIISETGVTIDIDDQAGEVKIASANKESLEKAVDIVKKLIEEPEIGKMYLGKITKIANFGAFCEILPGKEGLIHVSELAEKYVSDVSSEVKVGEEVLVKIIEIDQQGRINLSRKQVLKAASGEKNKNKT